MNYLTVFLILLTLSNIAEARQERSYREKAEFMRHHPSTGKVKVRWM
jgi:hypothetical protein